MNKSQFFDENDGLTPFGRKRIFRSSLTDVLIVLRAFSPPTHVCDLKEHDHIQHPLDIKP